MPSTLWNGMVAPLLPYAIKGAIWYQGESNGDTMTPAVEYAHLFPDMITDWRAQWKQGDFPFVFVLLAKLQGFGIAGADQNFVWAKAVIDGDTVVVTADSVATPTAVRYDWAYNPAGNLYNKENFPANPFRTDDWAPVIPVKK